MTICSFGSECSGLQQLPRQSELATKEININSDHVSRFVPCQNGHIVDIDQTHHHGKKTGIANSGKPEILTDRFTVDDKSMAGKQLEKSLQLLP